MEFIHRVNEEMVKLVKKIESDEELEYVNKLSYDVQIMTVL